MMFKRWSFNFVTCLTFLLVLVTNTHAVLTFEGAGVSNGDLYLYSYTDSHMMTQDGAGGFTQLAWYQDTLAYTRVDELWQTNLWVSKNGGSPYVLVENIEAYYPISFTENGLVLFAQNTSALSETQWVTDVYTITTEANSLPNFIGLLDSSIGINSGCGGGSPLPTDWQRWTELGFGGQHRILEMTPYGIVYSLDCAGMCTGLLNLETNETTELGNNFGNIVVSSDRTHALGIVYDTSTAMRHTHMAIADLQTREVHLIETAAEPDQLTWSTDGNAVFYTVYQALPDSIPMTDKEQQTLGQFFGVTGETYAGFPLYTAQIHRYDLTTQADEVIYDAPDGVSSIGRLYAVDNNTLVFSQIPNLQAWIAAIADGQFDPSSAEDTHDLQLDTVPVTVLQLNIDTGFMTEIGNDINLFTPALQTRKSS